MASGLETKIQVLIDKIRLLLNEEGGFGAMESVDRKLLLKYTSQLRESLQVLVGSPDPESPRVDEKPDEPEVAAPPEPVQEVLEKPAPENLPDQVLKELEEVQKNRSTYERVVDKEDTEKESRQKSINTVAREKTENASVNERFADETSEDLALQLKKGPITSLTSGINLNDKLWFVKDLFGGDADSFNTAMKNLDAAGTGEDAKVMFNKLVSSHNWNPNDRPVTKLLSLVQRRYL